MQAPKHNYEPIGCDNTAFNGSFSNRETSARKNLNELFQQAVADQVLSRQSSKFETSKMDDLQTGYEDIDLDNEDEINKPADDRKLDRNGLSKSKSSLNNAGESSHYPVEAQSIFCEAEVDLKEETELKNSPIRTPSFKTAISSSESGLDIKKIDPMISLEPDPSVSCSTTSNMSKFSSPTSVASLPISPRAPNQTSTPGHNPHLSSSILSETGICRICHEGDSNEDLVAPCYCAGSVGALHLTCLERWLGTSNTTRCEICKYQFKVERHPRSLWQFLRQPTVSSDKRNMMCDVICFMILTPLTGISAFLCMMGVQHYAQWDGRWEVPGLAILTSCLLVIYSVWCCVAMRHHYKVCREWQEQNQIIKIRYLSPAKGKIMLETKLVGDKNHSCTSPTQQNLLTPCTSTPSTNGRTPSSFNRSMLRPILRYSANLDAFNTSSHLLDANFTLAPSIIWTENEIGTNERNVLMSSFITDDVLRLARETYV